ncbi:MAG: US12 family protein [Clostridia bacterium]|nr:US12 family protein [Clostridia bacterium]
MNNIIKSKRNVNERIISDKTYYLTIAATLFFGFLINAIEVIFFADQIRQINPVVFFIIYFVGALGGVLLNVFSTKPALSFIGYLLVVLPLGMLLSLIVPQASFSAVRSAFLVTTFLTVIFGVLAIVYPKVFYSIYTVISIALIIALLYQIVTIFVPIGGVYWGVNNLIDWVIVILFCCYIGFNISAASRREKTLDSAIDSACALYVNIINVFVRLIAIFSRRR